MWHFVPCGCQLRIIHFFLVWYLSSISFCVLPSSYLFNILILASFYRFSWFRCLSAYFFLRIRPSHEGRSFWTPVKAFLWKDQCEAIKLFFFFWNFSFGSRWWICSVVDSLYALFPSPGKLLLHQSYHFMVSLGNNLCPSAFSAKFSLICYWFDLSEVSKNLLKLRKMDCSFHHHQS